MKTGVKILKSRKNKQLFVRAKGKNGKKLHHTENFITRQSAFTNIASAGKIYVGIMSGKVPVIDEQGNKWFYINGKFRKL